jgi:sn-glycerol 3-phosphate transport system substrate-binding protein
MNKTTVSLAVLATAVWGSAAAAEKIKFEYWYGLSGDLGETLKETCNRFNASQEAYEISCVGYDGYELVVQSAIAAFRAGKAPTILQSFDAGTADLMMSGEFYPVQKMMADFKIEIDWDNYFPGIKNYYSSSKGELFSMPFNSSTAVMYYNIADLEKAGVKAPETWEDFEAALKAVKAADPARCAFGYEPSVWIDLEQFSAIHNIGIATNNNGYDGTDTQFNYNTTLHVKHMENIQRWMTEGLAEMKTAATGATSQDAFAQNQCAFMFGSIASHSSVHLKAVEGLTWDVAMLPIYAGTERHNSVVGGASLWVLSGKTEDEYRGAAEYMKFLATPESEKWWVSNTGYIPVTKTAFDELTAEGFYSAAPYKGREVAMKSLTFTEPGPLTRGYRLGSMIQTRAEWKSEVEAALAGQKTMQEALDTAVERSNVMLAKFAKTYEGKTLP